MKPRTSFPEAWLARDRQKPADLDAHRREISIQRGDVRRAARAADGVFRVAHGPNGLESGVVLMSAILLIERLAAAHGCRPLAVIRLIEHCFEQKAALTRASGPCS
ncbi:MAG TPA: hypothetical protein VJV78_13565 [Polyangiales bacterium]|nr:hypothetical protein [Polyangiales bacterium]